MIMYSFAEYGYGDRGGATAAEIRTVRCVRDGRTDSSSSWILVSVVRSRGKPFKKQQTAP